MCQANGRTDILSTSRWHHPFTASTADSEATPVIIRCGKADPGEHEQIFSASDHDQGYNTRARSASQQLAVFSPSSTVAVFLACMETPARSVMALFWEEWGSVSGFQEGNRSRVSVWERWIQPRRQHKTGRQTCWYSWHLSLRRQGLVDWQGTETLASFICLREQFILPVRTNHETSLHQQFYQKEITQTQKIIFL